MLYPLDNSEAMALFIQLSKKHAGIQVNEELLPV
jgi:hypothetical protein